MIRALHYVVNMLFDATRAISSYIFSILFSVSFHLQPAYTSLYSSLVSFLLFYSCFLHFSCDPSICRLCLRLGLLFSFLLRSSLLVPFHLFFLLFPLPFRNPANVLFSVLTFQAARAAVNIGPIVLSHVEFYAPDTPFSNEVFNGTVNMQAAKRSP